MANVRTFLVLFLILFVLAFIGQNIKIVEVQLLLWEFQMPRSLLIFAMLTIGFIIGRVTRPSKRATETKFFS